MALIKRLREKLINAFLIFSLAAVFSTIIVACYLVTVRLADNTSWVAHSYQVSLAIDAVLSDLENAETGGRGYVITGQPAFLEPYTNALQKVHADFKTLTDLTKDNPDQQVRLSEVQPLIDAKLANVANVIALRTGSGFAAAQAHVATSEGKNIMDAIRAATVAIRSDEATLLQQRLADTEQARSLLGNFLLWGGIIGFLWYLIVNYIIAEFVMGNLVEKPLLERERRALEEVLKANKEMEAFSYSVSHDLRAPLRAIDGFTQILTEQYADKLDDEGKRIAGIIRASTVQMGKLIDDLLSFSRLGRQDIKKNLVNMSALVNEVYTEVKKAAPEKSITFTITGTLPDVQADINMMRVVWTNLLSNAVKFTSKKDAATIEVGGAIEGAYVMYYVKDNGAGFDMQYINKLFGVFQRLHSTEEFEGTGVGLANVKRVVERHGGTVRAEAKVGEGAAFYFTLLKR